MDKNKKKSRLCERLPSLIKEEEQSNREYRDLGLDSIAKDELRHSEILRKLSKGRCK